MLVPFETLAVGEGTNRSRMPSGTSSLKAKRDLRSTRDGGRPNNTWRNERRTRRSSPPARRQNSALPASSMLNLSPSGMQLHGLERRAIPSASPASARSQSRPLKGRARACPSPPPPPSTIAAGGTAGTIGVGSACKCTPPPPPPPGQAARRGWTRPGGIKCIRSDSDFYGSGREGAG